MFYRFMRFMVRISLHFYTKRIGWEGYENVPKNKPILFASTHSNSFLDALYLAASLDQAVYCLARGDAFRKPLANKILRHFRVKMKSAFFIFFHPLEIQIIRNYVYVKSAFKRSLTQCRITLF